MYLIVLLVQFTGIVARHAIVWCPEDAFALEQVEIFVNAGRASFTSADTNFSTSKTGVILFNQGSSVGVPVSNVSAYRMGCGWSTSKPTPFALVNQTNP